MTIIVRDGANTPRTITDIVVRDGTNTPRTISEIRVRDSNNVSRVVYTTGGGGGSLTVTITPNVVIAYGAGTGTGTTETVTASASGGTAPYSYAWTTESWSGDSAPSINFPTAPGTSFTWTGIADLASAEFRCTATDANGNTGFAICSGTFINNF